MDGAKTNRAARGFTLIELLVVLVIIGIILTVAGLSLGGPSQRQQADEEAQRLAALISLANQQAVLETTQLGLRVERDGYYFVTLIKGKWQPSDDELLRRRHLPAGIQTQLNVEGLAANTAPKHDAPQVLVLPDGEMTPFEVELNDGRGTVFATVKGSAMGQITVEPPQP